MDGAEPSPQDRPRLTRWAVTILKAEVQAAMEAGEIRRDDVHETCLALWAQAHGLIALHRAGRFDDDPEGFRGLYRRSLERLIEGIAA
ncbi:MAG: TetR-like C-terminal domain-containing protein [Gemmatimonadota bacterium]